MNYRPLLDAKVDGVETDVGHVDFDVFQLLVDKQGGCQQQGYTPDTHQYQDSTAQMKTVLGWIDYDLKQVKIMCIFKIFENILYKQIYEFALSNELIPYSQCDFRKSFFSTTTPMLWMT